MDVQQIRKLEPALKTFLKRFDDGFPRNDTRAQGRAVPGGGRAEAPRRPLREGADWASFVVTDGRLVTGQNPASTRAGAEALLKLLA